jgi:hypothetical protein
MKSFFKTKVLKILGAAALIVLGLAVLVPRNGSPLPASDPVKQALIRPASPSATLLLPASHHIYSSNDVEEPDNDETTASTDMEGPLVFINGNGLTQEDAMGWLLRGALESELKGPKMDYFNALEGLSAADTPKLFQLLPTIKDPAVRQFIVMQLQTKADAETIQNVVDHFDQTSDPEEKKLMLEILQHMSSPSSAPLLTNAVRDDGIASNDLVVTACVKALAALGDESGLTAVLDRVSREQDVVLRYDLFTGMMNAGNPAVKNFLLRTAQGGAGVTAPVRQSAIYALRAYGDPETLRLLQEVSQCAVPSIAAAAQDSLEAIERVR